MPAVVLVVARANAKLCWIIRWAAWHGKCSPDSMLQDQNAVVNCDLGTPVPIDCIDAADIVIIGVKA
jgi:hypothetical protein